jgi:hypothetical protein
MPDSGCNECNSWPGSPTYPCDIPNIADGDSVDASTTNAPINDLSSRTEYLRCFLESLEIGQAHFVKDVTFDSEVALGDVVYYDATTNSYKKAFVAIKGRDIYDNESCDTWTLDSGIEDSSYPFGVVVEAGTDNVVCISGQFSTSNYTSGLLDNLLLDYANLTSASKVGQMYLSMDSLTAGKVTKNKPALGVPICFVTPDDNNTGHYLVTVRPVLHDLMLAHRHYSFRLVNEPATNLPIGYNANGTNSDGDANWVADTTELDVYLYEYTNNGTPANCPYTLDTTLTKVGTAIYAGNGTAGGMIHSFKGNDAYTRMILEDAECISQGGSNPDDSFEAFLAVWDRGGEAVAKDDDPATVTGISIFQNSGLSSLESAGDSPLYRITNSTTNTIEYRINSDYHNTDIAGWMQCDGTTCASGGPGEGAKFFYNVDGDATLSAVWPPYPVQSSVLYIDGAAPHTSQLTIDTEGIFWFDLTEDGTPFGYRFPEVNGPEGTEWTTNYNGEILPKEALLYYTILASKTDEAVVQSLTPKEGSMIKVTDENGETAASGRLVIDAEFTVSDDSPVDGSYVVKDFDAFAVKKGHVVEAIQSGPLIDVSSTVVGGQGIVTISAADFGGVRESEPDMFFADDILLERHEDVFYKVFPAGRTSSVTGKVFIPTFLPTSNGETYSVDILAQIISPSAGSNNLGSLSSDYKVVDTTLNAGSYAGATGTITGLTYTNHSVSLGTFSTQYNYKVFSVMNGAVTVTPGDLFVFKLTRSSSSLSDPKVGILDVRYQISKA